jgi:hypothetical protein
MELFKILTDEHIETIHWLNKCSRGTWSFNKETGLIDVRGSFDCTFGKLKDFRGVKFGVIGKNFDCSHNNLKSLEGAPQVVKGDFYCSNNRLTSLVGAPQEVGCTFNCSYNKLTNLVGVPQNVKSDFFCNNNKLINLVGAPQEVGVDFYCSSNNLTSLEGAPQKVGKSLYFKNNTISEETLLLIYETMCTHKCDYHKALTLIKDKIDMKDKIELGFYKGHERATSIICRYI